MMPCANCAQMTADEPDDKTKKDIANDSKDAFVSPLQ